MKKTLTRSKTFDSDLAKGARRISRQATLPTFGHSNEFDYKREAKHLAKGLKQCETANTLDLDFILHSLSTYSCEQRLTIIHDIEYEYNYNLIDMVLARPESPMRSCTLALLIEPVELYVRDFHDLLVLQRQGPPNSNIPRVLVEILLILSNTETKQFKETYETLFESPVSKDIELVHGENAILSKLLIQLLAGKRYEESGNSITVAKTIAKKLHEAGGEEAPAIDYDTFIKIFTRDGFSQLSTIFDFYEDKYGQPIQTAIEKEFQGHGETECFQDIVEYTRSPGAYYSRILRQALEKSPIDYVVLNRIIIGHEEKDFDEIKLEYSKIYDETLDETIRTRIDIPEIKRLFILIITKREDLSVVDVGHVRSDSLTNSNSIASGRNSSIISNTASSTNGMRRNRSHDTFDKFVHAIKTIRPH